MIVSRHDVVVVRKEMIRTAQIVADNASVGAFDSFAAWWLGVLVERSSAKAECVRRFIASHLIRNLFPNILSNFANEASSGGFQLLDNVFRDFHLDLLGNFVAVAHGMLFNQFSIGSIARMLVEGLVFSTQDVRIARIGNQAHAAVGFVALREFVCLCLLGLCPKRSVC